MVKLVSQNVVAQFDQTPSELRLKLRIFESQNGNQNSASHFFQIGFRVFRPHVKYFLMFSTVGLRVWGNVWKNWLTKWPPNERPKALALQMNEKNQANGVCRLHQMAFVLYLGARMPCEPVSQCSSGTVAIIFSSFYVPESGFWLFGPSFFFMTC